MLNYIHFSERKNTEFSQKKLWNENTFGFVYLLTYPSRMMRRPFCKTEFWYCVVLVRGTMMLLLYLLRWMMVVMGWFGSLRILRRCWRIFRSKNSPSFCRCTRAYLPWHPCVWISWEGKCESWFSMRLPPIVRPSSNCCWELRRGTRIFLHAWGRCRWVLLLVVVLTVVVFLEIIICCVLIVGLRRIWFYWLLPLRVPRENK